MTIPAGAASQMIDVTPVDDPFSEPNETVTVTLNHKRVVYARIAQSGAGHDRQ